ncbi:ribonuclease E/G [Arthrobacter sp. H35-D1]|uniref:ribonuclease E/G n=1 Tax=Arthrobacter sp. H35-D1 TaxID=3046202 RepID=UPI0024B93BA4|nr:ribonuclease E/G [Arthrobacter sp. H35-D1]MDJ0313935.1 Rne/Rng family ribonuclease [Arthrobacter sp. H35-D1]
MDKEQASTDNAGAAEAAPTKARTTRSRRATAAVTSPGKTPVAAEAATSATGTSATASSDAAASDAAASDSAAAPATAPPARRSRAKRTETSHAAAAETPMIDIPDAAGVAGAVPAEDKAAADKAPADSAPAASEPAETAPTAVAPKKRTASRRATAPVTAPGQGELSLGAGGSIPESGNEPAKAPAKRTRTTKTSATKTATDRAAASNDASSTGADAAVKDETASVSADSASVARDSAPSADVSVEAAQQEPASSGAAAAKGRSTRRSTRKTAPTDAPATDAPAQAGTRQETLDGAPAETATDGESAAPKATRSRRRTTGKGAPAEPVAEAAASGQADHTGTGEPATQAVANPATTATTAAASTAPATATDTAPADTAPAAEAPSRAPDTGISALFLAPDLSHSVPVVVSHGQEENPETGDGDTHNTDSHSGDNEGGDRRGRNRRNRRNRSSENDAAEVHNESDDPADENDTEETDDGVTSRRRRRRRRGDADLEMAGGSDEDPPNTVTRVRAPRTASEPSTSSSNRVTSLRGSTRLEAKKQRRRDSRDSGRRRTVITEAEFLARRESVDRVMVVRQSDDRIQIGVLEDGILAEHFVSKTQQDSLIGNVYLGKVQNVLPSMEAAFVDIGRGRNAVLYAGEVDWDAANLNGQPRRIENALKSGDSVLVQVSKDPVGHKGARLTSQISLPGRYLVFVPGGSMTGISRKLPDVERNRLKRVLKDHLPENAGVIVRTAAEGASEEELTNDINRLRAQWEGISARASSNKTLAPEMLYAEPDLTIKVVRDVFNEDFTKLVVSGEDAWDTIEAYVTYVAPDLLDRLEKWTNPEDIFTAHRIDEQINKALERKVFLPSGGSLVIDRTEAMTVVDVNTGKFTGSGGNLEETVTKNNLEAAEEVVRQLRLRDIGGIIVIDFIDMVLESNRDLVLRRLVECLGRDRTKHQVAEVTSLGLIQMTRKRMGTGLLEVFGEQCPSCAGRGMVTHEIPVEHHRVPAVHTVVESVPSHQNRHEQGERTANRSTRSERKRNRNRGQQNEAEQLQEASETHVPDEVDEAAKAQKAHEARAALANIAAAAAASHHEHDGEQPRTEAAAATAEEVTHDAATLTLGGEAVELPRGHRSESSGFSGTAPLDRDAALAGLTQALDQLAAPGNEHGYEADAETGNSRARSRKGRRNRSARSAQGGSDTAVETNTGGSGAQGSVQHSSATSQGEPTRGEPAQSLVAQSEPGRPAEPAAVKKSAAPIILGVGVPAAEL